MKGAAKWQKGSGTIIYLMHGYDKVHDIHIYIHIYIYIHICIYVACMYTYIYISVYIYVYVSCVFYASISRSALASRSSWMLCVTEELLERWLIASRAKPVRPRLSSSSCEVRIRSRNTQMIYDVDVDVGMYVCMH